MVHTRDTMVPVSVLSPILFLGLLGGTLLEGPQGVDPSALEWFRRGEALIGTPREYSREQLDCFRRAVALAPDFAAARYNLILVYLQRGERAPALEQLEAWGQRDPEDPRGFLLRGRIRMRLDRLEGAAQDFSRFLEVEPAHGEAWRWLGQIRYQQQRYPDACRAFETVLEQVPDAVEVFFDLALARHAAGDREEARRHYQNYLVHFPDDFQANFQLGLLLRETGQHELALQYFLNAEARDSDHPGLAQELGNLYLDLDRLPEARQRLLRASRESAVNLANLGVIAKRQGRMTEALAHFRQALEREPQNALIWAHTGDVLVELGRREEAAEAYRKALRFDPDDLETWSNLGNLYAQMDQLERAVEVLQRGLAQLPCPGQLHLSLALVLDRLETFEESQKHYLKAIDCGADRAHAHFRLAFLFSRQKLPAQALQHLEVALERNAEQYVPYLVNELRQIRSDLDSIRYTEEFSRLLARYRGE